MSARSWCASPPPLRGAAVTGPTTLAQLPWPDYPGQTTPARLPRYVFGVPVRGAPAFPAVQAPGSGPVAGDSGSRPAALCPGRYRAPQHHANVCSDGASLRPWAADFFADSFGAIVQTGHYTTRRQSADALPPGRGAFLRRRPSGPAPILRAAGQSPPAGTRGPSCNDGPRFISWPWIFLPWIFRPWIFWPWIFRPWIFFGPAALTQARRCRPAAAASPRCSRRGRADSRGRTTRAYRPGRMARSARCRNRPRYRPG